VKVTEEQISGLLQSATSDEVYFKPLATSPEALSRINGALFLRNAFATVTNARVQFDKIRHSVAICSWLLENDPSQLAEVAHLIEERLKRAA
jgi:hypothetical protein